MSNMTLKKPVSVQASKAAALAFTKPETEKTTRLNAYIKVGLHTAFKVRAKTEGTTIGALIDEWIDGCVNK